MMQAPRNVPTIDSTGRGAPPADLVMNGGGCGSPHGAPPFVAAAGAGAPGERAIHLALGPSRRSRAAGPSHVLAGGGRERVDCRSRMRPTLAPLVATVEPAASEFLDGWDPEASRLFVPALADSRAGALAAVRIAIRGTGIAATVMGTVVAVRRAGSRTLAPGVFLTLQGAGASAAVYLAHVARGRPVDFNEREPRYAFERRITITRGAAGRFESTTVNVSESGCGVRWVGPAPAVGETLRLRAGPALLGPALDATVCWVGRPGAPDSAGLRLHPAGRGARMWRSLVEEAARSGAPFF